MGAIHRRVQESKHVHVHQPFQGWAFWGWRFTPPSRGKAEWCQKSCLLMLVNRLAGYLWCVRITWRQPSVKAYVLLHWVFEHPTFVHIPRQLRNPNTSATEHLRILKCTLGPNTILGAQARPLGMSVSLFQIEGLGLVLLCGQLQTTSQEKNIQGSYTLVHLLKTISKTLLWVPHLQ